MLRRGQERMKAGIYELNEKRVRDYIKKVMSKKDGVIEVFYDSILQGLFYMDGYGNKYHKDSVKIGVIEKETMDIDIECTIDFLRNLKNLTLSEIGKLRRRI